MINIKAWLKSLFTRKLLIAFLVAFIGGFADALTGLGQTAQPITGSVLEGLALGALGTAVRALLIFSPFNLVPSDATAGLSTPVAPPHPAMRAGSFAHLPLGRGPMRVDKRTLQLVHYLTTKLPKIPAAYTLAGRVTTWPMYGNDRLGDCTLAAVGHMIEAWTAAVARLIKPSVAAVEKAYWETGDPPSAHGTAGGPTDNGRVELDVLNFWRKVGVGGHKILAYTQIKPKDHASMKAGAYLCGGLYVGIALPLTAQTQPTVWDVVGDGHTGPSAPGSWGGHAIDIVGYDAAGLIGVTWGALIRITWRFVDVYFEEAYAIVSKDFLGSTGETPAGLDLGALEADVAAL